MSIFIHCYLVLSFHEVKKQKHDVERNRAEAKDKLKAFKDEARAIYTVLKTAIADRCEEAQVVKECDKVIKEGEVCCQSTESITHVAC